MHQARLELEARGQIRHDFSFYRDWDPDTLKRRILDTFKDKDLLCYEHVKVIRLLGKLKLLAQFYKGKVCINPIFPGLLKPARPGVYSPPPNLLVFFTL